METIINPALPVLILDTCAVLDVVRSPLRKRVSRRHTEAVLAILAALRSEPKLQVVIPSIVREELARNFQNVRDETARLLEEVFSDHEHAILTFESLRSQKLMRPYEANNRQLIEHCCNLADDLLEYATEKPTTDDDEKKAFGRSINGRPPARRGKDSVADCLVTEFALRLAKSFVELENPMPIVFLSSNTTDYCDGRTLKSHLQSEFDDAGLKYCRNWTEAYIACLNSMDERQTETG